MRSSAEVDVSKVVGLPGVQSDELWGGWTPAAIGWCCFWVGVERQAEIARGNLGDVKFSQLIGEIIHGLNALLLMHPIHPQLDTRKWFPLRIQHPAEDRRR